MEQLKPKEQQLEQTIFDKIAKCEIVMKPKLFYIGIYSLLATSIIGLFLVAAWLINLIIHKVRSQQLWSYLSYGDTGMTTFMHNIPSFALFLSLILFICAVLLLKKFDFFYKRNILLILSTLTLLVVGCALFMEHNGLNKQLDTKDRLWHVYHNHLLTPDWVIGTVIYRDTKGYYVSNVDGRFFRAIPANKQVEMPVINKSECIKVRGVIVDKSTIRSYNYYKCPYRSNR